MTRELRAIKGTRDILPGEVEVWQRAEDAARRTFALYGYREIRTPVIEPTELFQKSTGSDTDIVTKEMYTFLDRGERSVTLRPEGTPGVVRAVLAGLVTGILDELWQIHVPGRVSSHLDFLADSLGIVIGQLVYALWARRPGR